MSQPDNAPIALYRDHPDLFGTLGSLHDLMAEKGLPPTLAHLVELRVSQINGCAHCVDMHATAARHDGETSERLDRLVVWRHVDHFSESERAALAWAEALTLLHRDTDFSGLRSAMREHFDDEMIVLIGVDIAMINLWNRLQMSAHH
ncbi:carboxymuconolactone decarboxylase family protein [Sphingomicrobium sediminis]|uniref:Carboxymuconolactone decarboxylase family protein n=1 Tax=Sphingomicrobium sediminis TaxID=2950949 RepID=A0A9X2J1E8_9SPHN|nr:carboxymuconolactone decarboxylase family protein [Sphingomicrobium sediminis]MCM8556659.1 carboxymuconolactone decarboxylase family protein [Sphingomicrobium sediminis]